MIDEWKKTELIEGELVCCCKCNKDADENDCDRCEDGWICRECEVKE